MRFSSDIVLFKSSFKGSFQGSWKVRRIQHPLCSPAPNFQAVRMPAELRIVLSAGFGRSTDLVQKSYARINLKPQHPDSTSTVVVIVIVMAVVAVVVVVLVVAVVVVAARPQKMPVSRL